MELLTHSCHTDTPQKTNFALNIGIDVLCRPVELDYRGRLCAYLNITMIAPERDLEASMTWATDRLDALTNGRADLPEVVKTLKLGTLDEWGQGWIKKRWEASPDLLNSDGSMFGGYIAALADQALAFAAMTVVPADALFRTLNLRLDFVRVGRAHPLLIDARVSEATKQVITVSASFRREDGKLIAEASAQQLIMPMSPKS